MIKVRKKYIFLIILFLLPLLFFGFIFNLTQIYDTPKCVELRSIMQTPSGCGYLFSDQLEQYHYVNGVIENINVNNKKNLLTLKLKDSNGIVISQKFIIPSDPLTIGLTEMYKEPIQKYNTNVFSESRPISTSQLSKFLKEGQEVMLDVPTLNEQEIKDITKNFGKDKVVECLKHQKKFIQYIKKSSLNNFLIWKYIEITQDCPGVLFNITIVK